MEKEISLADALELSQATENLYELKLKENFNIILEKKDYERILDLLRDRRVLSAIVKTGRKKVIEALVEKDRYIVVEMYIASASRNIYENFIEILGNGKIAISR